MPICCFNGREPLGGSGNSQMGDFLTKTLEANPNHTGALLMFIDNSIDAENYEQARELLDQVKEINPNHPKAWAYEAVIAHLHSDKAKELESRDKALDCSGHKTPRLII
jgi:Tfp pilus assembly protein PilF